MTALTGRGNETYTWTPGTSLKAAQRQIIEAALRCTNGNKVAAARLLGINRNTLHNHCAKLHKTSHPSYVERRGYPKKHKNGATSLGPGRPVKWPAHTWKPGAV